MTEQDEEYLLERMNASFQCKWHEVTPEYMKDLERRRKEYQKSKYIRNYEKPIENFDTDSANPHTDWLYTLFS